MAASAAASTLSLFALPRLSILLALELMMGLTGYNMVPFRLEEVLQRHMVVAGRIDIDANNLLVCCSLPGYGQEMK